MGDCSLTQAPCRQSFIRVGDATSTTWRNSNGLHIYFQKPLLCEFFLCWPLLSRLWLALLLLLSGDIETNPGPTLSKPINPANRFRNSTKFNENITQLKILQTNINGISNKILELQQLTTDEKLDIIAVQESKLTKKSKKDPYIQNFSPIRKDRDENNGGGLIIFVKQDIKYTELNVPKEINQNNIEMQIVKIHLNKTDHFHLANIYLPPRNSSDKNQDEIENDIDNCFTFLDTFPHILVCGDFNAHSTLWHSYTTDKRGIQIANNIAKSNLQVLNENMFTRQPYAQNQQPSSPDITLISSNLVQNTTWAIRHKLSSDHLPILIDINTKTRFRQTAQKRSYTNYRKADWTKFTAEIENHIPDPDTIDDVHTANEILTNLILSADEHYVPKGKIKTKNTILPDPIRQKISERDSIRKTNPKDSSLTTLNNEINKLISDHKTNIWKEKLDKNWDHKNNSHILWNTISALSNKKTKSSPNASIKFNGKFLSSHQQIANAFNKQFTGVCKHSTHKSYRKINREIKSLNSFEYILSHEELTKAIKESSNNNSTGPDNINIKHLKHLGPRALDYLLTLYNLVLNTNIIPMIWKTAKIIPIPKPNKNVNEGSSYRPISLLSPIAKTLEKIILPSLNENIPQNTSQHGFKKQHSTSTALHKINETIANGLNKNQPAKRSVVVALDMSKAFDTVNIHKLTSKLLLTNVPDTIKKFIANYLRGRQAYTVYQGKISKQKLIKFGVPQGGVLSPTLFNLYLSDLPIPPDNVQLESFADDLTTISSHSIVAQAESNLQPYLDKIYNWTVENNLSLNADKSTATIFTLDQSETKKVLNLKINNTLIPTVQHPKILGLTFDPKLNYLEHQKNIIEKANNGLNMMKALTSTAWGKQKETLITTYKTIIRPILENANTVWSPTVCTTNLDKLQVVQNNALRIATGCTKDTNIQHLHEETLVLPLKEHLQLHASLLKQKSNHPNHPLHTLFTNPKPGRLIKKTIFNNKKGTIEPKLSIYMKPEDSIKCNLKTIHSTIVFKYTSAFEPNKIINQIAPSISELEKPLPRKTRRILSQLRTGKSPFLMQYKNKSDSKNYSSNLCPLCKLQEHDTGHLFNCPQIPTKLTVSSLWNNPVEASDLLEAWSIRLGVENSP